MYLITKPLVEVVCDSCGVARTSFTGSSVTNAKFEARDAGWKLGTEKNGRGMARCPDCGKRGVRII